MKIKFLFFIFIIFALRIITFAQANKPAADWFRVRSENGEFSIEVPVKNNYFYNKDGFWVSRDRDNYHLREMNLLNAYHEKTLLSIETYKGDKKAIKALYWRFDNGSELSDIKINGVSAKKYVYKKDNVYFVMLFFNSKDYLYVVSAGSRNGETPVMRRFLDSLYFNPDNTGDNSQSVPFSVLKQAPVGFVIKEDEFKNFDKSAVKKDDSPKNDNVNSLLILSKLPPAYTDDARMKQVQGTIQLKLKFSEDGFIPTITATKVLPEGLLRQTIFAAIRIKFLPEEKDEKPEAVTKILEYNFTIY